jgi:hypothetical protein
MNEHIYEVCYVCGSDFGEGEEKADCLRVLMPHCSAFYACVCLECCRAIANAVEGEE